MVELIMRRRAGRAGEVGLFIESPVFEEDFAHIKMGAEVKVVATTPRSLRQLKFAWGLASKIADACDWVDTKEDAMDFMLVEARHYRRIFDPLRQIAILRPKPTNFGAMDGTEYTKLLKRLVHVATTIMVPGMDDGPLKAEIEAMLTPDLPSTPDRRPEPPPVDTIPDGPGMGHNSRNAAEGPVAPVESPPAPEPPPPAPEPAADPEPPQPRDAAPKAGTVQTVEMEGDPDWTKDQPGDAGSYAAYARFHIEGAASQTAAMAWLLSDDQWHLRTVLRVPIGTKKQLERYTAERHAAK